MTVAVGSSETFTGTIMTSTDIQNEDNANATNLKLVGNGSCYDNFYWTSSIGIFCYSFVF